MVSVRGDKYGVLSLQFMIDWEGGGSGGDGGAGGNGGRGPSFVEFRFLPVGREGSSEDEGGEEEGGGEAGDERLDISY